MEITNIQDSGNDILAIEGTHNDQTYKAQGWVSATTNHYDASSYQEDDHRKEGSQPREMTETEKQAYCTRLLYRQNGLVEAP